MLAQYLDELNRLFRDMEISGEHDNALTADDGARAAVALIEETKRRNGKAIVVGNGGSAALTSPHAVELRLRFTLAEAMRVETAAWTESADTW